MEHLGQVACVAYERPFTCTLLVTFRYFLNIQTFTNGNWIQVSDARQMKQSEAKCLINLQHKVLILPWRLMHEGLSVSHAIFFWRMVGLVLGEFCWYMVGICLFQVSQVFITRFDIHFDVAVCG